MNRSIRRNLPNHIFRGIKVYETIDLLECYTLIGNSTTTITRSSEECIYCDKPIKKEKQNHPHLIPDLFGYNNSFNSHECNTCNAMDGSWATSLGTLTTPMRIISKVKGKSHKIPKFKSREDGYGKPTIIYWENDILKIKLATKNDYTYDPKKKQHSITFRLGRCNTHHIYKAFLKIALSLMPEEILLKEKWMTEQLTLKAPNKHDFPLLYNAFLDDKKFDEAYFELRQLSKPLKNYPSYIMTGYFGKVVLQFILPMGKPSKKLYVPVPPVVQLMTPRDEYHVEIIDLFNDDPNKFNVVFNFNKDGFPMDISHMTI